MFATHEQFQAKASVLGVRQSVFNLLSFLLGRVSEGVLLQLALPSRDDLPDRFFEANSDVPIGIMFFHLRQIAVVANVITDSIFFDMMLKALNRVLNPGLIPAGVTRLAKENSALVVVDSMDLPALIREMQADLRSDQPRGTGNEN
jgi:hypothetical protein